MDIEWLLQMPQPMMESGKAGPATLALRAGDLLTASVLDVEKGHDALLSFGQFKAYARLPLPVITGQEIQIRVEDAGQQIRMVMVPKLIPTKNFPAGERLEISLFEPVSDRPFLSTHSRWLVPGEPLQGRITGFEKNGLMLVDFGKFKAFTKIDIPVRQGQIIPLSIMQTDGGITLTVASTANPTGSTRWPPFPADSAATQDQAVTTHHASAVPSGNHDQTAMASSPAAATDLSSPPTVVDMAALREQIQKLLNGPIHTEKASFLPLLSAPMKTALVNLQQALNPASSTGDMTMLVARVRGFVENSGLYFEKRLEQTILSLQARSPTLTPTEIAAQPAIRELMVNDLKPNLLILKQFLDMQPLDQHEADRHMLETLKGAVQRAVSHIAQQQFMATEKPMDPDLFQVFSHLILMTDTPGNARLKVYYAKKGRADSQRNPRVSLLLEMDRMGTVRADLWMVNRDLNVTFFVKEAKIKAAIEAEHHRIKAMLKDSFNTVAVSVVVSENRIAEFDGEALTIPKRRQVDLNI